MLLRARITTRLSLDTLARKDSEDVKRFNSMPPEVRSEYDNYVRNLKNREPHPNKGICIWFDEETRKCKHYDLRPSICREEVKVNDEACHRWREAYRITVDPDAKHEVWQKPGGII